MDSRYDPVQVEPGKELADTTNAILFETGDTLYRYMLLAYLTTMSRP